MIKCQHCGRTIPYDANLCPYCGRSIKQFQQKDPQEQGESQETQAEVQQEPATTYQPPKPKNDRRFLFFVLAVLALLLIAGVIYRTTMGGNDSESPSAIVENDSLDAKADTLDAQTAQPQKTKVAYNPKKTQYVVVDGDGVRLRFGPSLKADYLKDEKGALKSVIKGTKLECTGQKGDWYQVIYMGKKYYMSKQYTYLVE